MKTPKHMKKHIDNKEITEEIIEKCIESLQYKIRNIEEKSLGKQHDIGELDALRCQLNKYKYYLSRIVSVFVPVCVLKKIYPMVMIERHYSYEPDFYNNKYIDYGNIHSYYDFDSGEEIEFYNIYHNEIKIKNYFVYKVNKKEVYVEIQEEDFNRNKNLPVIEEKVAYNDEHLKYKELDKESLLSTFFIKRVVNLIKERDFIISSDSAA